MVIDSEIVGKIAGVISLAAFLPYIYSILKGETKPNRASWWIWTVAGTMLGASYYASGARDTIWVPVSYVIGPFIVALISTKYGEKRGWNKLDRACMAGTLFSTILWFLSGSPLIALTINLVVDVFGVIPTLIKSYHEPESEDRTAWAMFITANIVNLFAITNWGTYAEVTYPVYMALGSGLIAIFVWFRPRKERKG